MKQAIFTLHLWLGLASGGLFSVVCCSGFLLALHPRLEARLNSEMLLPPPAPVTLNVEGAIANAVLTTASDKPYKALEIPADPGQSWRLRRPGGSVYLNPYDGQAMGDLQPLLGKSYDTIEHLHRWLLLDREVGRPITGAAAITYLAIMLSGVALWLTKCYRNPSRGLTFRRGVGWKRAVYDAHLVLGAYALLPLFLSAATGLYWSYREPYKRMVYGVLDRTPAPLAKPSAKDDDIARRTELPYSTILEVIAKELPYRGTVSITFPKLDQTTVTVSKIREAGFWRFPVKDEMVFDADSGQLLERKPFSSKTRAERLLSQMLAIHTGVAWGDASLFLYLLATLFGATMPITGAVMWANRMKGQWRAKEIMAKRRAETAGPV